MKALPPDTRPAVAIYLSSEDVNQTPVIRAARFPVGSFRLYDGREREEFPELEPHYEANTIAASGSTFGSSPYHADGAFMARDSYSDAATRFALSSARLVPSAPELLRSLTTRPLHEDTARADRVLRLLRERLAAVRWPVTYLARSR